MNRGRKLLGNWLDHSIQKEDVDVAKSCDDICFICKTPGNLLLCDGPCKRAFHFRCLKIKKSDVEGDDWFCDDCLNNRPLEKSVYVKLKKDDVSLLYGDVLELYNFLYKAVHMVFEEDTVCVYNGVQLAMILSEISQSASYPLCSSVFHLLHYTIDKLSPSLRNPIELNDFNDFQNTLDLLQLLIIMERSGIPHDYKKAFVKVMPTFTSFQQALVQLLSSAHSVDEQTSFLRILLLSSYVLTQLGLHSSISLHSTLDLTLSFLNNAIIHLPSVPPPTLLSALLRLLQTLLLVLTHSGELLLHSSLFPHLTQLLAHPATQELALQDFKTTTWYFTCIRYFSFSDNSFSPPLIPTFSILEFLQTCDASSVPLACNGVRVLFPRHYRNGFGPYPTSAFPIINKHNHYKNETPTSIAMFPLSLVYNLHGLYLTSHTFQNGTIINNTAVITRLRMNALLDHSRGKIDLQYTSTGEGNRNVISAVSHASVFRKRTRGNLSINPMSKEEDNKEAVIRKKVQRRLSRMQFINGVESVFYQDFIANEDKLTRLYTTFAKSENFPFLQIEGQSLDSFLLLQLLLKQGGGKKIEEGEWSRLIHQLGFDGQNRQTVDMIRTFYMKEFVPFEK